MTKVSIFAGLALAMFPALALAAEEGVIAFHKSTMFWTVVTFGIVLAVLWKFAWGPLLGSLEQREKKIRDAIEEAKKAQEAAEKLKVDLEERLEKARAEAEAIIKEGREDALRVKQKYEKEQRDEGEALKQRALTEIDLAKGKALEEIRQEAKSLAIEIAARVLEREVKEQDHERLVQEALEGYDRAVREMEKEGS